MILFDIKNKIKTIFIFINNNYIFNFFVLVLYFFFWGCGQQEPRVCITTHSGTVCVSVEVARTAAQRRLGLMYRNSLKKDRGMLFIFDEQGKRTFTMSNTRIPLDMIFIDREYKIVGWVENATPLTPGPYSIEEPSSYVLETNAFFCKKNKIMKGARLLFKNISFY